jgi:hypothetical protein
MQSRTRNFPFDANFDFGTDSLLFVKFQDEGTPFPPHPGFFLYLNNGIFTLLDGQNLTLL